MLSSSVHPCCLHTPQTRAVPPPPPAPVFRLHTYSGPSHSWALLPGLQFFTSLCCFQEQIFKNLIHKEVAAQSSGGRMLCEQGLQEAGWLFSSFISQKCNPEG